MQACKLIIELCFIWLTMATSSTYSKLTNETTSGKIVVVGGGIAGLSVCYYLQQNGIKDYVLIEASDRIGGRIQTVPFENNYVELGAQYIHGTSGPTYDIAKQLGLIDTTKYKADTWFYASQNGTKLSETVVEPIWEGVTDWLDETAPDLIEGRYKSSLSVSIGKVLDDYYTETVYPKYKNKIDEPTLKAIFKASIDSERIDNAADDLKDVGAEGWNEYVSLGDDVILKYGNNNRGYATILDFLLSKIPASNIYTNQKIEQIDLTNVGKANGIKMTVYSQTDKTRQTIQSTYLVSTVSLGVLKKDMSTLFKPVALPAAKQDAINKLGFGCVDKLFVVFDKAFTDERFEGLGIIWRDDLSLTLQAAQKWKINNNKFYKAFNTFERLPQYNNVLFGFLVGEDAEYIESLDDQVVLDYLTEVLQKVFPNRGLPKPVKILRTRWRNNEYARGSYTYVRTGTSSELTNTLAQPIGGKVYFAGEATLAKYIGTAHGAFISGQNVAKKIIKDLGTKN